MMIQRASWVSSASSVVIVPGAVIVAPLEAERDVGAHVEPDPGGGPLVLQQHLVLCCTG